MATDQLTVVIICDNAFHRGREDGPVFSADRAHAVAVSEPVSIEEAEELVAKVEGYRCPQLDAVQEAEKNADPEGEADGSSSKLDRAPMPEGAAGAGQQAAREPGEEAPESDDGAEADDDDEDDAGDTPGVLDVKGIGEKTLPDLKDAGVETAAQLVERDAQELAEKVGHSVEVVEKWQAAAAELVAEQDAE